MLSIRNWQAPRQGYRIKRHILAAIAIALLLIASGYIQPRAVRIMGLVANVAAFSYFRERLRSDIEEFRRLNPSAIVSMRTWYSAIGWGLLPVLILVAWGATIAVVLALFRVTG
jgi:hypothetical protein